MPDLTPQMPDEEDYAYKWSSWLEAFSIFARYCEGGRSLGNIGAEHDVIYVWPDKEIEGQDKERLEKLGWQYDEDSTEWWRNV